MPLPRAAGCADRRARRFPARELCGRVSVSESGARDIDEGGAVEVCDCVDGAVGEVLEEWEGW